jgi:integrase/recombinase XerD
MSKSIKLGKTETSRSRAKAKAPVLSEEALQIKKNFENSDTRFIDYLLHKGHSRNTVTGYMYVVQRFEDWLQQQQIPLETIRYADVLHYIQHKRSSVSQSTVRGYLNSLRHYFEYHRIQGTVSENPVTFITIKGVKRRKLYDILSKQELEQLYHDYSPGEHDISRNHNWYSVSQLAASRNKVITGLLIYQGLTAFELQSLTISDLRLREGKVFISGGRSSNERELLLESVQIIDLMEYTLKTREELLRNSGKQSEKLIISTGTGTRLNNTLCRLTMQLQARNPKVKSLRQIRASVITHWLKIHNLRQVQYMAGHRYISSTEFYLVNDMEDLQEEISKFHPIG